jgi:hypothetical protein
MGFWACSAEQQSEAGDVRFGSKADIAECGTQPRDVRFVPKADICLQQIPGLATVVTAVCAASWAIPSTVLLDGGPKHSEQREDQQDNHCD